MLQNIGCLANLVVHLYFFYENSCLLYDSEGRFRLHSIRDEEAKYKLCKLDLEEKKIVEFIKLDFGNVVMVTGGRNRGRVGVIRNRTKLKGSFETTTTYKTQQDMSLQQG
ncbi:hypothetical protein Bca101_036887 [Brassica carinata]